MVSAFQHMHVLAYSQPDGIGVESVAITIDVQHSMAMDATRHRHTMHW